MLYMLTMMWTQTYCHCVWSGAGLAWLLLSEHADARGTIHTLWKDTRLQL